MNKLDAIDFLAAGKRLAHLNFSSEEWLAVEGDGYIFEDGNLCTFEEFWRFRTEPYWETGWFIWEGKSNGN